MKGQTYHRAVGIEQPESNPRDRMAAKRAAESSAGISAQARKIVAEVVADQRARRDAEAKRKAMQDKLLRQVAGT